ncbi:hypothetical protein [Cupriavidus pauculus]|uniref:Uncharacterized protein n=1 Tax=Cupriavidus pauculus TaxID=82633 RepID=A0A3G8GWH4_9BURK|nr:hypothetical protein [Cupriavidus pauculus]AZG12628.1 hypothetical protein EHF44_03805 [Cupriavidus pauculus]
MPAVPAEIRCALPDAWNGPPHAAASPLPRTFPGPARTARDRESARSKPANIPNFGFRGCPAPDGPARAPGRQRRWRYGGGGPINVRHARHGGTWQLAGTGLIEAARLPMRRPDQNSTNDRDAVDPAFFS